jgi:murein DD-endopeptidase MepM/ murein hydrolase activator NlpD
LQTTATLSKFKVKQKEVFLKDLLNQVPPVSPFWLLPPTGDKNNEDIPSPDKSNFERRGLEPMVKMAALTVPMFLMSLAAQPVQAWEVAARTEEGNHLESVTNLTIKPVIEHQIQSGDTLWELSQEYETSPQEIAQHNGITPEQVLPVGETLAIPLTQNLNLEQPQILELPIGGVGGAVLPEKVGLEPSTEESLIPPIPRVIGQGIPSSPSQTRVGLQSPIRHFLADVEQLQANYEQGSFPLNSQESLHGEGNGQGETQGQVVFSPVESSQHSSANSLATAPMKVDFYNRFLNPPIGETVTPELPPLSSPEQYLPGSPQQFNGYIWPAEGVFTSGYGMRWGRMHRGIDIAAPIGTPIVAAAPGEVMVAGWSNGGYGNLVKLKHPDGSLTLYAHNNKVLVRKGQEVDQGQQIAEMGSTGRSTGPHLHFEVHPAGKGAVNPLAYLPQR